MSRSARTVLTWSSFSAASALLLLSWAGRAHALATEQFGNARIENGLGFSAQLLAAVNQSNRVYWYEVNANPFFYFRGNTDALNDALRKFAAIPAERREIILMAGPGETRSLVEQKRIPYDWCLHVPGGFHFTQDAEIGDTRATLTIYINAVSRPLPADPRQIKQWLADLDNSEFRVRDHAARELSKLGNTAGPALRQALKGDPSPEVRRRLEALLTQLPGIDLAQVDRPAGVPFIESKDLVERYRKAFTSSDGMLRGYAISGMARADEDANDLDPELFALLKSEKHEYTRRCLASELAHLGAKAKGALPALQEYVNDPDQNVRNAFQQAVKLIENSPALAENPEELRDRAAIREQIHAFCKAKLDSAQSK